MHKEIYKTLLVYTIHEDHYIVGKQRGNEALFLAADKTDTSSSLHFAHDNDIYGI